SQLVSSLSQLKRFGRCSIVRPSAENQENGFMREVPVARTILMATRTVVLASFVALTACARVDQVTPPSASKSVVQAVAVVPANANLTQSTPGAVPSPAGLRACFGGDGNARDVVSNNLGAILGGTTFSAGRFGNAFDFHALNDGISIPNTPSLN